jgi:Flp pilus assembly pilin Flp
MMRLMRRIHEDEQGAVSLETILIVGAIALPILIFLIRVGWPRIRDLFDNSMTDLEGRVEDVNPKQ